MQRICRAPKLSVIIIVLFAPVFLYGSSAGQNDGHWLPTGVRVTPLAAKGTVLEPLNPGLKRLPNFVASMAVATAVSPDGNTLLVITAGYNQNYDANGNTIADASMNTFLSTTFPATSHAAYRAAGCCECF